MDYVITEEFKRSVPNGFTIVSRSGEIDHRSMVIRETTDLEYEFKVFLLRALRKINPGISDKELENKGIFSEPNMLSSLSKCSRLAKLLNFVNDDEHHDIKKFVELRNMYAHDRHRNQLDLDPDTAATLRSLRLYQNSKSQLSNTTEQHIFLCCIRFFKDLIIAKRDAA